VLVGSVSVLLGAVVDLRLAFSEGEESVEFRVEVELVFRKGVGDVEVPIDAEEDKVAFWAGSEEVERASGDREVAEDDEVELSLSEELEKAVGDSDDADAVAFIEELETPSPAAT